MNTVEQSIEVNVPLRTAYNQWTQFEEFPRFMEGVNKVIQQDDKTLLWEAEIGGVTREWTAVIDEQTPDQRISWHAVDETNAGVVTFHVIDDKTTRVMLQLDYQPEGVIEGIGDLLGFVKRRVAGDLARFKEFIESRGSETGAWRGEIDRETPTL